MKIGILTSGGDCPGLNAVIRGAVLKGIAIHGHEFVGFLDGWRGVVEGDIIDIPRTMVRGIAKQGGTILGTSRTNPFENGGGTSPNNRPQSTARPRVAAITPGLAPTWMKLGNWAPLTAISARAARSACSRSARYE